MRLDKLYDAQLSPPVTSLRKTGKLDTKTPFTFPHDYISNIVVHYCKSESVPTVIMIKVAGKPLERGTDKRPGFGSYTMRNFHVCPYPYRNYNSLEVIFDGEEIPSSYEVTYQSHDFEPFMCLAIKMYRPYVRITGNSCKLLHFIDKPHFCMKKIKTSWSDNPMPISGNVSRITSRAFAHIVKHV